MKGVFLALVAASLGVTACQSTAATHAPTRESERIAQLIAARQGEAVDRVCFTDQIDSWSPLGDHAVLLRKGVNDWYKLDLSGTCRPNWAFNTLALRTRPSGSLCVTPGDDIETHEHPIQGHCVIDAIYAWNERANVAESGSAG